MEQMDFWVTQVRNWIWGLLFLLLGVGCYLTVILKGFQLRYLRYAIKETFAPTRERSAGDISHFESLMTTLAGAIGTGAIVGLATGVTLGGMGALFWMWVTAFLAMAIKYAESLLSV